MEGSLFGHLPAELRNDIYSFFLPATTEIIITTNPGHTQPPRPHSRSDLLALARTPRSIYRESVGLYYSINTWTISITPFYPSGNQVVMSPILLRTQVIRKLQKWLDSIGHNLAMSISRLRIMVNGKLGFLQHRSGFDWDASATELERQGVALGKTIALVRSCLAPTTEPTIEFRLPLGSWPSHYIAAESFTFGREGLEDMEKRVEERVLRRKVLALAPRQRVWSGDMEPGAVVQSNLVVQTRLEDQVMERVKGFLGRVLP